MVARIIEGFIFNKFFIKFLHDRPRHRKF